MSLAPRRWCCRSKSLCRALDRRGVDTLVDGAHAPGMVPLDVARIGAAYYTGNCHKWLCAPKGAGSFMLAPTARKDCSRTSSATASILCRPGRSRFHDRFDWIGTTDYTPWLCVGEAIRFISTLVEGGLDGLMRRNHELVIEARRLICSRLGLAAVGREEMLGAMAAIHLPDDTDPAANLDDTTTPSPSHPLWRSLWERIASRCRSIISRRRRRSCCGSRLKRTTAWRNTSIWPMPWRHYYNGTALTRLASGRWKKPPND